MGEVNALTDGLDLRRREDLAVLKTRIDEASDELAIKRGEFEQEAESLTERDPTSKIQRDRLEFQRQMTIEERRIEFFRNIWLVAKSNLDARNFRTDFPKIHRTKTAND